MEPADLGVEIVRNALQTIAEEMSITLVKTAYSPVVRDALDFSTALTDAAGKVVAQGVSLALQLGAIPRFMRLLVEGGAKVHPGDVWLLNHPWKGGVHLPDFFFARPIFFGPDQTLAAFAVIVSHMVDTGGSNPGGVSVASSTLWDEGLVLPLVRLVRGGHVDDDIMAIIGANSRDPVKVLGDVRAVLAALATGEAQFLDLAHRQGSGSLLAGMGTLLERTEMATRAAIAELPDGVGHAVDYLDDDGKGSGPIRFECTVRCEGDHLHFDYAGTAPQVLAGINTTIADTISATAFAARSVLGTGISVNDGFYRCIELHVPEGSIANATYPAAVAARATTIYRATDVALAALAQLAPERVAAADGGPGVVYMSGDVDGAPWIFMDYVQAGWGARAFADGAPGVSHPIANAANMPVEVAELEFPVRIVRFGLVPGTAGRGRHFGAPAIEREYEALAAGTRVNYRLERNKHAPPPAAGGEPGERSRCRLRRRGGEWEDLPGKGTVILDRGDRLRIQLASGAGHGPFSERTLDLQTPDIDSELAFHEATGK